MSGNHARVPTKRERFSDCLGLVWSGSAREPNEADAPRTYASNDGPLAILTVPSVYLLYSTSPTSTMMANPTLGGVGVMGSSRVKAWRAGRRKRRVVLSLRPSQARVPSSSRREPLRALPLHKPSYEPRRRGRDRRRRRGRARATRCLVECLKLGARRRCVRASTS